MCVCVCGRSSSRCGSDLELRRRLLSPHIFTWLCMCVFVCVCTCVCAHACVHVQVCVCVPWDGDSPKSTSEGCLTKTICLADGNLSPSPSLPSLFFFCLFLLIFAGSGWALCAHVCVRVCVGLCVCLCWLWLSQLRSSSDSRHDKLLATTFSSTSAMH